MCRKSHQVKIWIKSVTLDHARHQTCVDDSGPCLDVDAGSSLPGPEDPHERLSGEDAGCFAHL